MVPPRCSDRQSNEPGHADSLAKLVLGADEGSMQYGLLHVEPCVKA